MFRDVCIVVNLSSKQFDDLKHLVIDAIQWASDLVFGPWTIALLFVVGLFLTIRLGFVQIVYFGAALRAFFSADEAKAKGALSPFQTFMTALGATIGTGNIAGVATAIVTGGPGALLDLGLGLDCHGGEIYGGRAWCTLPSRWRGALLRAKTFWSLVYENSTISLADARSRFDPLNVLGFRYSFVWVIGILVSVHDCQ